MTTAGITAVGMTAAGITAVGMTTAGITAVSVVADCKISGILLAAIGLQKPILVGAVVGFFGDVLVVGVIGDSKVKTCLQVLF